MIKALRHRPSPVAVDDLLQKLRSPRFAIRVEALQALSSHPADDAVVAALVEHVRNHQFTTAHLAAEILGNNRLTAGVPVLRDALGSDDFLLQARAMVALAQLDDRASIDAVTSLFADSVNPRIIINGARALSLFADTASVVPMMHKLEPQIAPFVRDEIVLAIAEVLGFEHRFYPVYLQFIERKLAGTAELLDHLATGDADIRMMVLECTGDAEVFAQRTKTVFAMYSLARNGTDISAAVTRAIDSPTLRELVRFRFLVAAIAVFCIGGGSEA